MAKGQRLTLDEVRDDEDYDPDESMMDGSNNEFSDLEMDEIMMISMNQGNPSGSAALSNDPTLNTSPTHGTIPGHSTPVLLSSQQSSNSISSGTSLDWV